MCLAGAHDPEDMLQRLSQMCSPILVTRNQAATVNAAAADRGSPTPRHAFRRLDSMDSAQSLTPGSRFDSFGTPPVQGEGAPTLSTSDIQVQAVLEHAYLPVLASGRRILTRILDRKIVQALWAQSPSQAQAWRPPRSCGRRTGAH